MAKKLSSLFVFALLVAAWALAAWQGTRVERLRNSEMFYYWVIGTANQYRLDPTLEGTQASQAVRENDRAYFEKLNTRLEGILPEIPLTDEDTKSDVVYSKLIRIVRDAVGENGEFIKPRELRMVWASLTSPDLADLRQEFLDRSATRDETKKLSSVGSKVSYLDFQEAGGNIANLFFGFRKVAANFIWLEVDRYYHQGMTQRMYPLMLTCVALDPHFVDAYLLGAWHLAYNATAHMPDTPEPLKKCYPEYKKRLGPKELYYYRAISLLKDGIWKNPWNYKLYFDLGYAVYEQKLNDHAQAVKYLSDAIRYRHDRWVPRMLYRSLQLNGQYDEAIAGWEDYMKKFPENTVAPRFLAINHALKQEKLAEDFADKAHAARQKADDARKAAEELKQQAQDARDAGNTEEADRLDQLAQDKTKEAQAADAERRTALQGVSEHYTQAYGIYDHLNKMGEDPFAKARMLWIRAKSYIESDRYLEAISLLDNARWQDSELWDDASKEIIRIKQLAGIELTLSEKLAVEREKEKEAYLASVPPCE